MDEKFCLKWNDFQSNTSNTFKKLRTSDHFYDVTLVSDDQQQVAAHRVVLSASSEYFKNILMSNKHSHPLLCLSGVSSGDLNNILDFIYNGEIQVYQDHLDQFLDIAQRFQLEGLIQGRDEHSSETEKFKEEAFLIPKDDETAALHEPVNKTIKNQNERIISLQSFEFENIEELDYKIEEMIEKLPDRTFQCKTCGKVYPSKNRTHLFHHVETHIDGLSFPCQHCDKSFRSRNSLRTHIQQVNKKLN